MPDFERLVLNRETARLKQLLESRRGDVRLGAIRGLGQARARDAVDELATLMDDEERDVRMAAIEALVAIRRVESTRAVIGGLLSERRDVRRAAWRGLLAMGGSERAPLLAALPTFEGHPELICRILDHVEPERALPQLIEYLDHTDATIVTRARERLMEMGATANDALRKAFLGGTIQQAREVTTIIRPQAAELVEEMIALLGKVEGESERQTALLYVLADTGDERVGPVLKELLRDESRTVRTTAMALITRFRKDAIDAFKNLLREPDFPDRTRLIAYVKQRWRMWGDALIDLLALDAGVDWRVRELAKMAVGGRDELLPTIVERYVESGDFGVDDVADLLRFDPNRSLERLLALIDERAEAEDERGERLWLLLRTCALREGPSVASALAEAAQDGDFPSPATAIGLLAVLGDRGAEEIVGLLGFKWRGKEGYAARVRGWAREAAVQVGAPCVPHLIEAIQLPNVTPETLEALARVGDAALMAVVETLLQAWRDGRDWKTYARVLAKLEGRDGGPLLVLVKHEDPEVRRAGLKALKGRGGAPTERALSAIVNTSVGKRKASGDAVAALDVLAGLEGSVARATMRRLVTHSDRRLRDTALAYVRRTMNQTSGRRHANRKPKPKPKKS